MSTNINLCYHYYTIGNTVSFASNIIGKAKKEKNIKKMKKKRRINKKFQTTNCTTIF